MANPSEEVENPLGGKSETSGTCGSKAGPRLAAMSPPGAAWVMLESDPITHPEEGYVVLGMDRFYGVLGHTMFAR